MILLGSSSKSRAKIFTENKIEFKTCSPDINEKAIGHQFRTTPDASNLTLAVANAKADAILASHPPAALNDFELLVTCDQVVCYNGNVREKPESHDQCREYLSSYSSSPAETHSAVVVVNLKSGKRVQGVDVARQYFKHIPDHIVDQLLTKGDIMYCCGGFMIDDELLFPYLDKRIGDADSIIGMPMRLFNELRKSVL